jgi:hypothetical protein
MKKIIILCWGLFVLSITLSAQSLVFYRNNVPLENNAVFTASQTSFDEFDALTIESGLRVKNLTNEEINASLRRTVITSPSAESGAILSSCFGSCVANNIPFPPPQTGVVAANALTDPLYLHLSLLLVEKKYTQAIVKYEIYPTDHPDDVSTVTVTYDYSRQSDLDEIKQHRNDIIAFQESDRLTFKYFFTEKNVRLEMFNILGNKVGEYLLNSEGTFILPEKLKRGIYVYTVKTNNKRLISKKMIIQ